MAIALKATADSSSSAFLASDEAGFITAQAYNVTDGRVRH
jgi:hypothetical protein